MFKKSKYGATLVELVVTIVVAGIAMALVFAFYTNVVKGFWSQTRKSENVKEIIAVRAKINREFDKIAAIVSMRNSSFDYIAAGEDSVKTAVFKESALLVSKDTIAKGLTGFTCSAMTAEDQKDKRGLLLWEALLNKDRWIAGAKEITMEDSVFFHM